MNFYLVFCKNRKKFDKYVKINRVKNKVIVDIKQNIEEEGIDPEKYKDYFNLIIYTRIVHSLQKGKDIYYIPNFTNKNIDIKQLFDIKKAFSFPLTFNTLVFYEEFKDDESLSDILSNLERFDTSQIIKDY
jgi:hypothetical protein